MALPQPTFLPYRRSEFVDASGAVTLGMELFGKYHPSALQQEMYNSLLEQTKEDAESARLRREALQSELETLRKTQQNYRTSGLGPTGKAAIQAAGRGGGGGTGGTSGDVMDLAADLARTEVNRNSQAMKHGYEKLVQMETYFSPTQRHRSFLDGMRIALMGELPAAPTLDQLEDAIIRLSDARATNIDKVSATDSQRKAAALEMYTMLSIRKGTRPLMGPRLAELIDGIFETPGYLSTTIAEGSKTPAQVLEDEKDRFAVLLGKGLSPDEAELAGRAMLGKMDTDGDGVETEKEAQAYLRAVGISSPLSAEEEVFLDRYVQALSDDGRATIDEFDSQEQYEQSLAAYRKGRRAPTVGRGYERFYDQTYLDNLKRIEEVQSELAGLGEPKSPTREAARRTLGLPRISPEDYEAAARVSPLAAESLPMTVQRYQQAAGDVSPRDRVERQAAQLIESSRNDRNFNAFAQQVNKLYPNDPAARRKAFAYYGAHYMQLDARKSTLNTAALEGNVDALARQREAAETPTEELLFDQEVGFEMQDAPGEVQFDQDVARQEVARQLARQKVQDLTPDLTTMAPQLQFDPAFRTLTPGPSLASPFVGNQLGIGTPANIGVPTMMGTPQLPMPAPTQPRQPGLPVDPLANQFMTQMMYQLGNAPNTVL